MHGQTWSELVKHGQTWSNTYFIVVKVAALASDVQVQRCLSNSRRRRMSLLCLSRLRGNAKDVAYAAATVADVAAAAQESSIEGNTSAWQGCVPANASHHGAPIAGGLQCM
jgi:hypothetical protein